MATTAPIEILLKTSSQTAIGAKAVDDRSNETTLILIGPKDEIIAVPRDNIALVIMDRRVGKDCLAQVVA